ncbi:MAG: peptidoglycan DD-metalloendopeptidase family protein [Caulobacteraceae bacterium]
MRLRASMRPVTGAAVRISLTSAAAAVLICASLGAPVLAAPEKKPLRGAEAVKASAKAAPKKAGPKAAAKKPDSKKADAKKPGAKPDAKKDAKKDDEPRGTLSDQPSTGSMAKGAVKTEAGDTVKVEKGQTLIGLAKKLGVSRQTLIDENKLKAPYNVRVGQTLKTPGKRYYQVQSGDTLYAVARRFGTPAAQLAEFNDFAMSKNIRAGQKIYLPGDAEDQLKKKTETKVAAKTPEKKPTAKPEAKVAALAPPKPAATVTRATVAPQQPGVIQRIPAASAPAVTTSELSAETGLPDRPSTQPAAQPPVSQTPVTQTAQAPAAGFEMAPVQQQAALTSQKPGVIQRIPSTAVPQRTITVPARTPETTNPTPYTTLAQPQPGPTRRGYPAALPPSVAAVAPSSRAPIIQTAPPPAITDVAAAGRGRFIWPLRGSVLVNFGPQGAGQRSDGVNIQAREGDAVRAAADGEVVYAGDQVPSFGNLVLIKHTGGWVTAYAHMGRIMVTNRARVTQGQQLGVAGATGAVTSPQLHFEVRYAPSIRDKAAPIDPMLVLPGG